MRGAFLEDLTWAEAEEHFRANRPVLIPIGAFAKEHGLHLPLGTDSIVARELARRVSLALPVVVAPVVGFGYYPAFLDYPGSQHVSAETFVALMTELLLGFAGQGVRRLVVLNTGYSTEGPLRLAQHAVLDRCGVRVAIADLRRLGRGQAAAGHADEHETSLMLAIDPAKVKMDRAVGAVLAETDEPGVWSLPGSLSRDPGSPNFSPSGATGAPGRATVERGRSLLAEMASELCEGLKQLYPDLA